MMEDDPPALRSRPITDAMRLLAIAGVSFLLSFVYSATRDGAPLLPLDRFDATLVLIGAAAVSLGTLWGFIAPLD